MEKNASNRISRFFQRRVLILLVIGLCSTIYALEYLGAGDVLRQVMERNARPADKLPPDEHSKLRDELKAFSQSATNLAPADAAKRWLELVDRAVKIQKQSAQNYNDSVISIESSDLLGALPPPATWNELAKAIAARPPAKGSGEALETSLRLLAATLTGDVEARDREIVNLQNKAKTANGQSAYYYRNLMEQINETLLTMSDDPEAVLQSLEYRLNSIRPTGGSQDLMVPNLIPQIGAEKAELFLRKALVSPTAIISFDAPNETSRLAQKLALELLPQLKKAQWGLINSLNSLELYEALDKRFGAQTNKAAASPLRGRISFDSDLSSLSGGNYKEEQNKSLAQIYYMLGLISHNRTKDAVTVAGKIDGQNTTYYFERPIKAMEQAGYTSQLDEFFYELLSQNPALPFWEQYVGLSAKAGKTDRMVVLLRKNIARSDSSEKKKASLRQILFKALLAADKVDEALPAMRELISSKITEASYDDYGGGQIGALMARLGMLLQKPELTEEGIGIAKKWLGKVDARNYSRTQAKAVLDSVVRILFELKRGSEAESLLLSALANVTHPGGSKDEYEWNEPPSREILAELMALYHQAGRYQDVLTLLEQSPNWEASDLSSLFQMTSWSDGFSVMGLHSGSSSLSVPYMAANALLATGKKEPARKIVTALIEQDPGIDRGYELLIALDGTNAIPRLDELFARDQFEERPLIWKAHLLRQQGRLEEAEKIARQAINIDPSDGEQGRDDRMRVYAELAEIREARGDKKDADFYREIVKAIRLSERADQFYAVGLLKRAIAMYEEGLNHFSDAYCIQSRLAIQLASLGKHEAAEEHYRRAFELMPDSFGRVESHCFGCERAFDGERPRSIAERVFTKLAEERPDKPQIHYLLGYLREEQERYNEALTNYLTAVRLDPQYLNAWVRIQGISANVILPSKQRDELVFNLLRLDPLQRNAHPFFGRVTDLVGLWNAVSIAVQHQSAAPSDLMVLSASKIALEKKKNDNEQLSRMEMIRRGAESDDEKLTPATAIAKTPFVQLSGQMMLNGGYGFEDE